MRNERQLYVGGIRVRRLTGVGRGRPLFLHATAALQELMAKQLFSNIHQKKSMLHILEGIVITFNIKRLPVILDNI